MKLPAASISETKGQDFSNAGKEWSRPFQWRGEDVAPNFGSYLFGK